jgi:hypothetical protein
MNFVPAGALGVSSGERLGFRPEWAHLSANGKLQGQVVRVRIEGAQQGAAFGLVTIATTHGEVVVRGELPADQLQLGAQMGISVDRGVAFAQQKQVGIHEFV